MYNSLFNNNYTLHHWHFEYKLDKEWNIIYSDCLEPWMLRTCFVLQPQWNIINSKCHIYRKPGEVIATFYFFRIEFHFVEKFVFLYYSNFPLQIEHNYIQSLCFTLNLWYWMSHFYSTKYFYTAHKCQEVKSWWHFKYIWKNYCF